MRVLLVAPAISDLPLVKNEVQRIIDSGLTVTELSGNVSHGTLLDAVISGKYDVFWYCGHATANGIALSDGELVASELVPMLRNRFRLVFLNSCDTRETAQALQNDTDAAVIATIAEVLDRLAFQTGALFAEALHKTGDIYTAYNDSKPGNNRTYVLYGMDKKKVCLRKLMENAMSGVQAGGLRWCPATATPPATS